MAEWKVRTVDLGDVQLAVQEAGDGPPLVIFHDELGAPGWQAWHEAVAKRRRLILPLIPGFQGERIKWIANVRDAAVLFGRLLRELKLGPVDAVGFSFGGWLAAEMALQNPAQFKRLALVAPFGLKAPGGDIADMFLMSSAEWIRAGFADPDATAEFAALYGSAGPEQVEAWEDARVECAQLGWQPYMHHPAMAQLLPAAGDLPVLVAWGDKDVLTPRSAVEAYARGFPKGRLEVLAGCGHRPEIERREAFLDLLNTFLAGADRLEPTA